MLYGATTISDDFDPRSPAREVPGGVVRRLVVSTPTAGEPVGQSELATWCRVDADPHSELTQLAKAAREYIERRFEMALLPVTVTMIASGPAFEVRLPRIPFGALTTVKLLTQGVAGADIASEYYILGDRLRRQNVSAIPAGQEIEVVYTAGFAAGACPADIKLAIKQLVATRYDNRSSVVVGTVIGRFDWGDLGELDHYRR